MAEKRPHPDGEADTTAKRPRSPAPTSNGVKPNIQEQIAAAKARAAALAARYTGVKAGIESTNQGSVATPGLSPAEIARKRVEELRAGKGLDALKARVAAATGKPNGLLSGGTPPHRTASPSLAIPPLPQHDEGLSKARGGLGIGLHPALMGDSGQDGRGTNKSSVSSRFSTTLGNQRAESPFARPSSAAKSKKQLDLSGPSLEEIRQNPYYDATLDAATGASRVRKSRDLVFNQKGKFIAQAAALRRQVQLEEMKKRIAESARKAGLDEDHTEKAFVVSQPPEIEWWDESLVDGTSYPDFDEAADALNKLKIGSDDSVVTRYVQHPVLIQPPQEKKMPAPKPMYMTKEEMKKKRRQDRMEVNKEKQAKVRLGLEAPEPPKIKKSNLMRVLGEQAVKDPTAVEARVTREIADREDKHKQTNEERKLTEEQKWEKLAANQAKDAAKGILVNVYRIDSLAYGKHRYQVDKNAKDHALTGITILNPKFNLVVVEGGEHSIKKYQKLMMQRIKWTDIAPPSSNAREATHAHDREIAEKQWLQPEDETGQLRDMSENRCVLVWEGEEKQRSFKYWGSKVCETDGEARRALERNKMENMWTAAKNLVPA